MTARDRILARLGPDEPASCPPPFRLGAGSADWSEFRARLAEVGGRIGTWDDAVPIPGTSALIDPDCLDLVPPGRLVETSDPWAAEVGVGRADLAVAECGALLLRQSGRRRLSSLTPPVHIVLVAEDALVASLEEAVTALGEGTAVLVTGPSRTADIEGVLVNGIHGPREIWVIMVPSRVSQTPADNHR